MTQWRTGLFRVVTAIAVVAGVSGLARAQELTGTLDVQVVPERPSYTYRVGEPVTFLIEVRRDGHLLPDVPVRYEYGPEMIEPAGEGTATSGTSALRVQAGSLTQPGFLRLVATATLGARTYRGVGTAAVDPGAIAPTVPNPPDFDAFWADGKAQLAKVPMSPTRELLPTYSTPTTNVYHVSLQTAGVGPDSTSRVYGILCEPKAPGRYPALLSVPGAGIRPYRGLIDPCERGIITLQIGIHGIPVTLDPTVYSSLAAGGLARYMTINIDDRDRYYYRRVYLATVRANDYLTSLPNYDGSNLGVVGGSQGGALAIVTAALDPRVKGLASSYPALADVTGYLHGRAGGWPHFFAPTRPGAGPTAEKLATLPYFDVVNFARRLRVPGIYTWGFNDETCPPTSIHAAYNVITAPKAWLLALETGHNTTPEQTVRMQAWMEELLTTGRAPLSVPAALPVRTAAP
jgi:cephalosporin-C deacetylase-like acetyl esterase